MDLKLIGVLVRSVAHVASEYRDAKSEDSDGGKEVTQREIIDILAKTAMIVTKSLRENDEIPKVDAEEIIAAFSCAGWNIIIGGHEK